MDTLQKSTSREKKILELPSVHGSTNSSRLVFPQLHAQIVKAGADAHVTRKGRINRISLVGSLETHTHWQSGRVEAIRKHP